MENGYKDADILVDPERGYARMVDEANATIPEQEELRAEPKAIKMINDVFGKDLLVFNTLMEIQRDIIPVKHAYVIKALNDIIVPHY